MQLPLFLQVFVAPRPTFRRIAQADAGFEVMVAVLFFEFFLSEPLRFATAWMQRSIGFGTAILGLWTSFVHFGLPVFVGVFVAGVVIYYFQRLFRRMPVTIWGGFSLVAYAYVAHLFLVATSVTFAALLQSTNPLWPHIPVGAVGDNNFLAFIKVFVAYGPTLGLLGFAFLATSSSASDGELPSRPPWLLTTLATLFVGVLAGAVVTNGQRIAREAESVRPALPGDQIPAFVLPPLTEKTPLQTTQFQGHVVLWDFWATWCPPCVASIPDLQKLRKTFANTPFQLLSVNVENDNTSEVQKFVREHNVDFPVYLPSASVLDFFEVSTLPTSVLVDQRGVIRHIHIGTVSYNTLEQEIRALLTSAGSL